MDISKVCKRPFKIPKTSFLVLKWISSKHVQVALFHTQRALIIIKVEYAHPRLFFKSIQIGTLYYSLALSYVHIENDDVFIMHMYDVLTTNYDDVCINSINNS